MLFIMFVIQCIPSYLRLRSFSVLFLVLIHFTQTDGALRWDKEPENPTEVWEGGTANLTWNYDLDGGTLRNIEWTDDKTGAEVGEITPPSSYDVFPPYAPRFQIDKNGEATLLIANVTRNDTGIYACKVQRKVDFQQIISRIRLDVLYPPENIFLSTSANVRATIKNRIANFTCTAEGNPAPHEYKFYLNNTYLGNSSSGIYHIRVTETGFYICVPVNKAGNEKNESVHINIVVPAAVSLPSDHVTVIEGNSSYLSCNVTGTPPLYIEWTKVNDSQVLSNTSELTLPNVTRPGNPSETVQYQCTARNLYGKPASAKVTVQVQYKPEQTKCETFNNTTEFQKGKDNVRFYFSAKSSPEQCNVSLAKDGGKEHVLIHGACNGSRTKLYTVSTDNLKGGDYVFTCSAENRVGRGKEVSVNISITEPVEVKISLVAKTSKVFQGSIVLLCLIIKGYPPPNVTCVAPDGKEFGKLECTNVKIPPGPTATYRCNVTNELGSQNSTFVKLDVVSFTSNDTKLTGQFKIFGTFTKELADENSVKAKTFKNKVIMELFKLFEGKEKRPLSIEIDLRNGSIIVDYTMLFSGPVDEVTGNGPIKEAVNNGRLGSFNVSSFVPKTTAVPPTIVMNDARTCKDCDKLSTEFIIIIVIVVIILVIVLIVVIVIYKKKKGSGDAKQGQDVVKGNDTPLAMQNMGYANEGPSACDGSGYVQVENGPAPGAAEGNFAEVGKAGAAGGVPLVTYAAVDQSKKKKKKKMKGEKLEEDDMQGTATYAQVDKSKKKNGAPVPEENTYAAVDMSKKKKKRKEGELFYADLSEFSGQRGGLTSVQVSPPPTPVPVKVPSKYEGTEYADISQFSSKKKEDKPVVGEEGKPEQQKPAADAAGPDGGIVVKEQEGSKDEQGQMEAKL